MVGRHAWLGVGCVKILLIKLAVRILLEYYSCDKTIFLRGYEK